MLPFFLSFKKSPYKRFLGAFLLYLYPRSSFCLIAAIRDYMAIYRHSRYIGAIGFWLYRFQAFTVYLYSTVWISRYLHRFAEKKSATKSATQQKFIQ
jgi:hypothetical protein